MGATERFQPTSTSLGNMRAKQYLSASLIVHTLSAFAADEKPFSLRIYTPVDDDFYIKTLAEDWTIDSHDKGYFNFLDVAERGIPYHPEAKYAVGGQINWTEPLSDITPVRKRAFWVGKGDPNVETRGLLKCTVSPRSWQTKDIWLFLGPQWSYTWKGDPDSLQAGWLRCLGEGHDWNDEYFVKPDDTDLSPGVGYREGDDDPLTIYSP